MFNPVAGLKDFELIFPSQQPGQLYKILGSRYRNAQMILEFLRFWQSSDLVYAGRAGLFSLENEENLDSEVLPPLFECYKHGIIWIPTPSFDTAMGCDLKGSSPILPKSLTHNYVVQKIKQIFQEIISIHPDSVAILYDSWSEIASKIKEWNKDFQGPYNHYDFNGKEAEIIIYVSSFKLSLQSMARARRLLIIITTDVKNSKFKLMNQAVKKNLVMKI